MSDSQRTNLEDTALGGGEEAGVSKGKTQASASAPPADQLRAAEAAEGQMREAAHSLASALRSANPLDPRWRTRRTAALATYDALTSPQDVAR